jgi:type IV secretory pathway VirB10-like protein
MGNAFDSPDSVQLKGKVKGVTRLSRRAKVGFGLAAAIALGIILFSVLSIDDDGNGSQSTGKGDQTQDQKEADTAKPVVVPAAPNFEHIGDGQAALAAQAATAAQPAGQAPPTSAGASSTVQGGQNLGPGYNVGPNGEVPKLTDKALPAGTPQLTNRSGAVGVAGQPGGQAGGGQQSPQEALAAQRKQEEAQRKHEMDERKKEAARAPLDTQSEGQAAGVAGSAVQAALAGQQEALLKAAQQLGQNGLGLPAMGTGGMQQQDDPNKQQRKEQFLKTAGDAAAKTYLAEGLQLPLSPYEIKAGWAIPVELQCGINSDLPGQFCGRVTENVYDSATGKHLLIPQYTSFTGTYDSQIAYGQERILGVINRLIFPDGSSINLGGMPANDKAGNAGLDADVNNHYAKVFGGAAFMATFSAAVSLTQKQSTAINGVQTNSQVISQSLGQQLGQTGSAFIQRGMNVQPTLSRPIGYRFNISLTKDIVFPGPYKRRDARPN